MTLTFESLPNEIWLIIFSYLSSRHTWRTFFGINKRLNQLLTSNLIRHTIDLKDISYPEIIQLLENHDTKSHGYQWQAEFVSHAYAICFENNFDYEILINRWIATNTNWNLSSLRTIYILSEAMKKIGKLSHELKFIKVLHPQLHYLHLVFDQPRSTYHSALSNLVKECISCPIMILEVTRGHTYQDWKYDDLYDIKHSLCLIRTVNLTISLQHSSELILLLTPKSLPLLEHLNVIIEQPREDLITREKQPIKSIHLSEKDLHYANADGTKLRSFQLIGSLNLPSLKRNQFQFLFRFPTKYEHEWIQRYFNNGWPFNNVGFHVDKRIVQQSNYSSLLDFIEDAFFIYSIPFDVLKYMRTIHNYELFTRHSTTIRKNFICQNMEWLCQWTNNEIQLIKSLQTNQVEIGITPTDINLCYYLRSLTFQLSYVSLDCSVHNSLLQLILDLSPHLFYLHVRWKYLSHCSGRYPMIKHVHLTLGRDGAHFDAIQFNRIIPKVHYLSFSGQELVREKQMVNFVCELLVDKGHFCELLLLQINKNGNFTLKPCVKENIKQAIVAKINRLKDSTTIQIEFSYRNQLSIWL
ncbi:unnamed protein product [Rotaria sordida]|uniref:F-box domain-containing protein n=1 Tax=Rotaria sordida TaxID=392033 RepID=A0A814BBI3_9BILA|nr:unnamed protein product [Rotaria sordida]